MNRSAEQIRVDVAKAGAGGVFGGGTIFTEPVLVVNQKSGTQVGAVRQVGQSKVKKVMRVVSSLDQFMTHKLQIVDMAGTPLLALTRPAK